MIQPFTVLALSHPTSSSTFKREYAMTILSIKIHPAIGIARLGDSKEFFVGPERRWEHPNPIDGYKDNERRIKRQAARFWLFAYHDDGSIQEITTDDAEITWTVHLANRKAITRNEGTADALTIAPGPRTLKGPGQHQFFDNGTISFQGFDPITVPLGEAFTEQNARLLVLGSTANSTSPNDWRLDNYLDNPFWYDTSADGPVTAHIRFNTGLEMDAMGAWVIIGPPKYAPEFNSVINLYDRIFEMGAEQRWHSGPEQPSYTKDIYPILVSAGNSQWVQQRAAHFHQWQHPIYDQNLREGIFKKLSVPDRTDTGTNAPPSNGNMPLLAGNARLTSTQYAIMEKWKNDQFIRDWNGVPEPSTEICPEDLDHASLGGCVGAAFFPGIEAGGIAQQPIINRDHYLGPSDPMRLNHAKVLPGGITEFMALPWQADFWACGNLWWPVPRPNQVIPDGQSFYAEWDRNVSDYRSMVENWTKLGFVVKRDDRYVETERDPDL